MERRPESLVRVEAPPEDLSCSLLEIGRGLVAVLRYSPPRPRCVQALTSAEEIVMKAIFEGKSNDAIARERGTSVRTIANQVASIFRKHRVSSRRELVACYLSHDTTAR